MISRTAIKILQREGGKWQDRWNKIRRGLIGVKAEWCAYAGDVLCVCFKFAIIGSQNLNQYIHTYIKALGQLTSAPDLLPGEETEWMNPKNYNIGIPEPVSMGALV